VGVKVNDEKVKEWRVRVESFEITDEEQLIGCELDLDDDECFIGVT
jgi:hypothetical protein